MGEIMVDKTIQQRKANVVKVEPTPDVIKNLLAPPSGSTAKLAKKSAASDSLITTTIPVNGTISLPGMSATYLGLVHSGAADKPYLVFTTGGTAEDPSIFTYSKLKLNSAAGPYYGGAWSGGTGGAFYGLTGVIDINSYPDSCKVTMQKTQWSEQDSFNSGIISGITLVNGQTKSVFGGANVTLDAVTDSPLGPIATIRIGGESYQVVDGQSMFYGNVRYNIMDVGKTSDGTGYTGFVNIVSLREIHTEVPLINCNAEVIYSPDLKNATVAFADTNGTLPFVYNGQTITGGGIYLAMDGGVNNVKTVTVNGKDYTLTISDTGVSVVETSTAIGRRAEAGIVAKPTASKFMVSAGAGKYAFSFGDEKSHRMDVFGMDGKKVGGFFAKAGAEVNVKKEAGLRPGGYIVTEKANEKNSQKITIR
jgi:hypothetical protein